MKKLNKKERLAFIVLWGLCFVILSIIESKTEILLTFFVTTGGRIGIKAVISFVIAVLFLPDLSS